ncbi:hypothetical protein L7F22_004820 [Adiantum nelumboides]|nr:hypothetical protein [Adiantum nelumboides]
MDASVDAVGNSKCEGTSGMEIIERICAPLSSYLNIDDVGLDDAGMENASDQGVVSFGMATVVNGMDVLHVESNSVMSASFARLRPLSHTGEVLDSCSGLNDVEDCATFGHPLSVEDLCRLPTSLDKGKKSTEFRGNKATQYCAICHDKIKAEEIAEIKGCKHSYCVMCILRWAFYKTEPWCPQCRLPFSFLYVYRALDGSLSDYLFEESVCLLLRAFWFKPLVVQEAEEQDDYQDDYDAYEESYYTPSLRLGNRRWGDSGYVRAGRREARPVAARQVVESSGGVSSSSRQTKGKEQVKEAVGRRARRAQKREQLDKMSAKE